MKLLRLLGVTLLSLAIANSPILSMKQKNQPERSFTGDVTQIFKHLENKEYPKAITLLSEIYQELNRQLLKEGIFENKNFEIHCLRKRDKVLNMISQLAGFLNDFKVKCKGLESKVKAESLDDYLLSLGFLENLKLRLEDLINRSLDVQQSKKTEKEDEGTAIVLSAPPVGSDPGEEEESEWDKKFLYENLPGRDPYGSYDDDIGPGDPDERLAKQLQQEEKDKQLAQALQRIETEKDEQVRNDEMLAKTLADQP